MGDECEEFSSFGQLVGLTRALDVAMAPFSNSDSDTVASICANVDATFTAWSSLLPASKKVLQRRDGSFDEILFIANAVILA